MLPLIIEDSILASATEPSITKKHEPLAEEKVNKLILKLWWEQIHIPDYEEFLRALLRKLQKAEALSPTLTTEGLKTLLEEKFCLTYSDYSERAAILNTTETKPEEKEENTNLISAPQSVINLLIDKETGRINPKGHVLSMRSNIREVKIIDTPDGKTMVIDNSVSSAPDHQLKLKLAMNLLKTDRLIIYGSHAPGNSPIQTETRQNRDSIVLACLHPSTVNRIWGEYNTKTGELVFLGIAKSHETWKKLIHAYEL